MDMHLLRAERHRIAEQFRSTLTCLSNFARAAHRSPQRTRLVSICVRLWRKISRGARARGEAAQTRCPILDLQTRDPLSGEVLCLQRRSTLFNPGPFSLTFGRALEDLQDYLTSTVPTWKGQF